MLRLQNVTKTYGRTTAVSDLSLAVDKGEIFGFLGPNGAGKTTTIKMILDVLRPTGGTIELFGKSSRDTAGTHHRVGFLSGDMALDEDLTGRQYLNFVAASHGGSYEERIRELANELQADLNVKIGNYSRGNRQKVGLIAALMHQPELLILDEPSSGFDPLMQDVFVRLTRSYRDGGGTVFISSHSLSEVQKLCDRVAFLRAGELVGVVDVDELGRTAARRLVAAAEPTELKRMAAQSKALPGLRLENQENGQAVFSYAGPVQPMLRYCAQFALDDLMIAEPELEEVFMSYYERTAQ